jgi:hypothetical protein
MGAPRINHLESIELQTTLMYSINPGIRFTWTPGYNNRMVSKPVFALRCYWSAKGRNTLVVTQESTVEETNFRDQRGDNDDTMKGFSFQGLAKGLARHRKRLVPHVGFAQLGQTWALRSCDKVLSNSVPYPDSDL